MDICAKQGYGDSLCGIYSLLNAICHFENVARDDVAQQRELFAILMMASERLGYLDYHHVVVGFEAFELVEVFNWVAQRFGYNLEAVDLRRFSSGFRGGLPAAINDALGENYVAVTHDAQTDHWVAITKDRVPLDSWPIEGLVSKGRAKRSSYGLIIKQISQD